MGHSIGIICDSRTGGDAAAARLEGLQEFCELGVERVGMSRQLGPHDLSAYRAVRRMADKTGAEILHGHGAKGGAYARLAARSLKRRGRLLLAFYTPHGGSLHYDESTFAGRVFLALERRLASQTDGLLFESEYASGLYRAKIGDYPCLAFIIPNGLWPNEFYQAAVDVDAADFLFIGELRNLKGVDVLLQALADIRRQRAVRAVIVGAGPDEQRFKEMAKKLALESSVTFSGAMPARKAFSRGSCLVVPSRAESFPYIVLEAAAASLPMILTSVGGIPEIVAGTDVELVPPGESHALRDQMLSFLDQPATFVERAAQLQNAVSQRFQAAGMAQSVCEAYQAVFDGSLDD